MNKVNTLVRVTCPSLGRKKNAQNFHCKWAVQCSWFMATMSHDDMWRIHFQHCILITFNQDPCYSEKHDPNYRRTKCSSSVSKQLLFPTNCGGIIIMRVTSVSVCDSLEPLYLGCRKPFDMKEWLILPRYTSASLNSWDVLELYAIHWVQVHPLVHQRQKMGNTKSGSLLFVHVPPLDTWRKLCCNSIGTRLKVVLWARILKNS